MSILIRSIPTRTRHLLSRNYNKIVITDDGSTIVALHKEKEFPYEFSKPLVDISQNDTSVLKMTDHNEVKRVFKEMKPEIARKQLASLTLTTTHRWFPRARDKKAKNNPMNRPYL